MAQDQATEWLWIYNTERPNMGIGGKIPAMEMKTAARILPLRPIQNGGITPTPKYCFAAKIDLSLCTSGAFGLENSQFKNATRHLLARFAAYSFRMTGYERTIHHIRMRRSMAAPLTKKVLRLGGSLYLAAISITLIAIYHRASMPLGIYTHPSIWVFPVTHLIAVLNALTSWYHMMYVLPGRRWLMSTAIGGVCYAFTFAAIAWGVPSLSVHFGAKPASIEAEILGASDLSRHKRTLGCKRRVAFGSWYAPGGSVCMSFLKPSMLIGSTLIMQGVGNGWATQITKIEGLRSRSAD